ncbi:MAG: tetratricopeptide repeat protein, partial [Bacteroidota bacterium]
MISFSYTLCAQNAGNDATLFAHYLKQSVSKPDSAQYYLANAEKLAQDTLQHVMLRTAKALMLYHEQLFDSARSLLHSNYDMITLGANTAHDYEIARSFMMEEKVLRYLGDYEQAVAVLKKADEVLINFPDSARQRCLVISDIAVDYLNMGRYEEAEKWLKHAIKYSKAHQFDEEELSNLSRLALVYYYINDIELSAQYHALCFEVLRKKELQNEAFHQCILHTNLGLVFEASNSIDSALHHYQEALSYLRNVEITNANRHFEGYINSNIGLAASRKNDFKEAFTYSNKAVKQLETIYGTDHSFLVKPLRVAGEALQWLGRYDESLVFRQRALAISKINNNDVIESYNALGALMFYENKWEEALAYYDSALSINMIQHKGEVVYRNHKNILDTYQGIIATEIASDMVDIYQLDEYFHTVRNVLNYVFRHTASLQFQEVIPLLLEDFYNAYAQAYQRTGDRVWLERMWEVSGLNKATKLRDQLKSEYSISYALPDDVLQREKALSDSISWIIGRLKPGEFDMTLFDLKRRRDAFLADLENTFPRYHALKNSEELVALDQLQRTLKPGQTTLSFFQGGDSVYVMTIYTDTVLFNSMEVQQADALISHFNDAVLTGNLTDVSSCSEKVKQVFLRGTEEVNHFFIVPDGIVWELNFNAIATQTPEGISFLGNEKTLTFNYFSTFSP